MVCEYNGRVVDVYGMNLNECEGGYGKKKEGEWSE